jgi:hypothetical protein
MSAGNRRPPGERGGGTGRGHEPPLPDDVDEMIDETTDQTTDEVAGEMLRERLVAGVSESLSDGRPDGDGELEDGHVEVERLLPALDGAPGPARRLSSARTRRMISAIVDGATAAAPYEALAPRLPPSPPPPPSPFDVTRSIIFEPPVESRPRIARRSVAMAAALVFASVGSAAAGVWIAMRERPAAVESPPTASRTQETPSPGPRRRIAAGARAVESQPGATPAELPAAEPRDQADSASDQAAADRGDRPDDRDRDAARPPRRREHQRARDRSRSQRQSRHEAQAQPESHALPSDGDTTEAPATSPELPEARDPVMSLPANAPVEDIVAYANQERKEKRWRAAEALYERVMRDHAGTDAAAIATVASASLHLDRLADPVGALRRYLQALRLRPDGPLAEEARWGLAETHRALGDKAAERSALRAFLAAHPRSVNAARARKRLTELGPEP